MDDLVLPVLRKFMSGADMSMSELDEIFAIEIGSLDWHVLDNYMRSKGYVRDTVKYLKGTDYVN